MLYKNITSMDDLVYEISRHESVKALHMQTYHEAQEMYEIKFQMFTQRDL